MEACVFWCKGSPLKIETLVKTKFGSKVNYIIKNFEISWCHSLQWETKYTKGAMVCTKCTHMNNV
jgi:hypothetical protein